jgi:predicted dehydrogenase
MVDHSPDRRYDSDFRTLHHLVQGSVFGTITECEIHYDVDFPSWIQGLDADYSPGDGLMFGLGSHSIDQALLLFGTPTSVTGFYRSLRGIESKTDDAFTIILQYSGAKKNLFVTVKTSVVAIMQYPLKYFVRGYDGTFIKYGTDMQESQIMTGQTTATPGFGVEPEATHGVLTTQAKFHESQVRDESGKWVGKFPSFNGDYSDFYVDLVKAIRGEAEVKVTGEHARNGIRVIELARASAEKGCTLPFN